MDRIVVEVNGERYTDWESIGVSMSLETAARRFDLTVADRLARLGPPVGLRAGYPIVVSIDDGSLELPVLTGYVEAPSPSADPGARDVTVAGRSKVADVIDCEPASGYAYEGTLYSLAVDLCAPFGVEVTESPAGAGGAKFPRVKIDPHEPVFEQIERLARARGCLLQSDGDGRLVIRRVELPTVPVAELTMPGNLESASLSIDASQLFSRYEVTGRADTRNAAEASERDAITAVVEDPTVGRYRLHRVRLESWATPEQCAQRAQWEAASRQGKATSYTCQVGSWRIGPGGDVWEPGMLVHVADAINGLDADMVVADVDLSYGLSGTRATLGLRLPAAYVPEPVFAEPPAKRRGKAKTPAKGVSWWAPSTGFGEAQ